MHKLLLPLLLLVPFSALAQQALVISPQHCVWHQGDNPAWAAPGLDESGWNPVANWPGSATTSARYWLRCRFQPDELAAVVRPELQISGDLAYELFADGLRIGALGNVTTGAHTVGAVRDYWAPALAVRARPLSIAVRMTFTPMIDGQMPLPELSLGDAQLQRGSYAQQVGDLVWRQRVTWACYALIGSAGLFFFALYWFDRTQRYILWISLVWLSLGVLRLNELLWSASVNYSSHLEFFLYAIGQAEEVFVIEFLFALNLRRVPWFYRATQVIQLCFVLCILVAVFLPVDWSVRLRWWIEINNGTNVFELSAMIFGCTAPLAAFWPLGSMRRWQAPIFAVTCLWMLMDAIYLTVQLPVFSAHLIESFLDIQPYRSCAIAAVVVTLTLLLVHRLRAGNLQRAELQGEMQAAREIQQYLIPEKLPPTPGLVMHSVYQPSREVGGDFFQVLPGARDGSALIVVGDVAGKGLKAGMLAALIVGSIRTAFHFTSAPGEILSLLNERLQGRGLVTCMALRVDGSGRAELANAGHLPPYLNGKELAVEGALPLGAVPGTVFRTMRFELAAGQSLLLVSDGVVEARSSAGELFGFERTRAISGKPADQIARAAQAFGQEDDITVLTLTFAPAQVLQA